MQPNRRVTKVVMANVTRTTRLLSRTAKLIPTSLSSPTKETIPRSDRLGNIACTQHKSHGEKAQRLFRSGHSRQAVISSCPVFTWSFAVLLLPPLPHPIPGRSRSSGAEVTHGSGRRNSSTCGSVGTHGHGQASADQLLPPADDRETQSTLINT